MTSKKAKHTPGPWIFSKSTLQVWRLGGGHVASVSSLYLNNPSDEEKANAALIAAAPELLEALKIARSMCIQAESGVSGRKMIEQIDAAIAKAEG